MKIKKVLATALSLSFLAAFCFLGFLFKVVREIALVQRGHGGVGGEVAILFIPIVVYFVYKNAKDLIGCFEEGD